MKHSVVIKCPACKKIQKAIAEWKEGHPFPTYIHECIKCEYIIMEDEWEEVEENKTYEDAK